jgi:NAD(P)-dependent dehydrogenase (short-subunit alcohol dehydrogenase family)
MPSPAQTLPFRPDGAYLITGGQGALGLHIAHWMVGQGARRLILLGRTPLPSRREWQNIDPATSIGQKVSAIMQLEKAGAAVHPAAVDIGDGEQLQTFLTDYAAESWPPIRGVVHAAGVVTDKNLLQLDAAVFSDVLRPKLMGVWHLHSLLAADSLDFFVLFSSFAAVDGWGASYAAANHFMDMLAH